MNTFFAGGNTSKGFVSYYDNIYDYSRNGKYYIIKGGSGVGKSTLMRKCAKLIEDNGYDVEYYICSGDCSSLDGIYCQALNIAMVDGTAPHIIVPKMPFVCGEKAVDLSVVIEGELTQGDKAKYKQAHNNKNKLYKQAYGLLASIENLVSVKEAQYEDNSYEKNKINALEVVISCVDHGSLLNIDGAINIKNRFVSAYSANGYYTLYDTLAQSRYVVDIKGLNRKQLDNFIGMIIDRISSKIPNLTVGHNCLNSQYKQAIIANNFIIGDIEGLTRKADYIYDFNSNVQEEIEEVKLDELIKSMTKYALDLLERSKQQHYIIEEVVKPYANWNKFDIIAENIINEIKEKMI